MTSPPPHLDQPTPALHTWFAVPTLEAWRAEASAGKAPKLSAAVPGVGAVDVLHTGARPSTTPWRGAWDVRPVYDGGGPAALRAELADDRGATSIGLVPHGALRGVDEGGSALIDLDALDHALADVDLARTPLAIEAGAAPRVWTAALIALAERRGVALQAFVHACPLGLLSRHGQADVEGLWDALADAAKAVPWRVLTVDARVAGEAGGEAIDELVWAVAGAHALLDAMDRRGVGPAEVAPRVTVRIGVDEDVFVQTAKLRALRRVWGRLLEACGVPDAPLYVHAIATPAALTRQLPHTNLIRAAVQGFAAAVGGADAVTLLPFDRLRGAPSPLALRQACTAQAVLAHEAGLALWEDPAAGAGLVEELTERLAAAAWAEATALGPLEDALRSGAWAARIGARRADREAALRTRRRSLLGVNLHAEVEEVSGDAEDEAPPAPPPREVPTDLRALAAELAAGAPIAALVDRPRAPVTAPALGTWTAGDTFEPLRAAALDARARLGRRPICGLVAADDAPLVRLRQDFAAELLALAGVDTVRLRLTEVADAALDAACLCASDERLASFEEDLAALAALPAVAVAAPPGPLVDGRRAVLLHRNVDVVAALCALLARLGEAP